VPSQPPDDALLGSANGVDAGRKMLGAVADAGMDQETSFDRFDDGVADSSDPVRIIPSERPDAAGFQRAETSQTSIDITTEAPRREGSVIEDGRRLRPTH